MSSPRFIPLPGAGRMTLALLALVPAALAYPWRSARDYWVLGIAVVVVLVLFAGWGGLFFTTILRRRLSLMRGNRSGPSAGPGVTTALLRLGPPLGDSDVLPLPLIASYLARYGIRADSVRITTRDSASDTSRRQTWVGLTISAADNLAALQARSSRIPLEDTAQVAARRLVDHLRETGWEANIVAAEEVPRLLTPNARESWNGVQRGTSDYIAAYQVSVDDGLSDTLDAIGDHAARETFVVLEIAAASGSGGPQSRHTVAVACAFLTQTPPDGASPLAGLTPQRGNQRPALSTLDLLSGRRIGGHTDEPAGLLAQLRWPTPEAGAHRALLYPENSDATVEAPIRA